MTSGRASVTVLIRYIITFNCLRKACSHEPDVANVTQSTAATRAGPPAPSALPAPARARRAVALLALTLLAGCTVGPDFKRPAAPDVSGYTARPPATTATASSGQIAGGAAQRFASGGDIPADWWTLFHSKPLNALIEQSLKNNPDLKAAQAALTVAHENVLAQRGDYFPSVTASASANRNMESTLLAPVPNYPVVSSEFLFNLFTPQVSATFP